jgi:hypothetical protein
MLLPACSLTLSLSVTSLPASTVGADVGEADTLGAAVGALDVGVALVGVALGALVGVDVLVVGADVGEAVNDVVVGADVGASLQSLQDLAQLVCKAVNWAVFNTPS